ncbi:MAG: HNH endonuclease [Candidatus Thorarchaeota archaeon]
MKKSKKQESIDRELRKIYQEYLDNNEACCYCCGTYNGRIDFSHLVPRSYNRRLTTHPDNIVLKCRDHHRRWEQNDRHMPKYNELHERVRKLDESYYNLRNKNV